MKIGEKFGMLTMVSDSHRKEIQKKCGGTYKVTVASFRCECGTQKELKINNVKNGSVKSCGCYNSKASSERMKKKNPSKKHGLYKHPLYSKWQSIKDCACEEWKEFENFYQWAITEDYDDKVVFRPDQKNNYAPHNCEFITKSHSAREKFKNNKEIWGKKYGVDNPMKVDTIKNQMILTKLENHNVSIGDRFNWLVVSGNSFFENGRRKIPCKCVYKGCDKEINVDYQKLKIGHTKSCGCFCVEKTVERNKDRSFVKNKVAHQKWSNLNKKGLLGKFWANNYLDFENWYELNVTGENNCILRKSQKRGHSPKNSYAGTMSEAIILSKTKDAQQKRMQSNLERFGVEHATQHPDIKQKIIDTKIDKYGAINPSTTLEEQNEIQEWLSGLGFSFSPNYDILCGKEVDLYNKDLNLGIEFCGLYWHCEHNDRGRSYHYNKYVGCENNGVRLITIFSDEWEQRNSQVKNFIKSVVGYHTDRVFARKCQIAQIDRNIGQEFFEEYHIQGQKRKAKVYFGLFYQENLIGCVSFNSHHRQPNQMTLDRLCFKDGFQIPGGASKLIKNGIKWVKEQGYNKIISWSDNRWSQGNVYLKTGFELEETLNPDYSYIKLSNAKARIPKQGMMKSKIGCPKEQTEKEFLVERGYSRVWDCGKKRWVMYL
jgi:predicted GNAT family N-acyltransferase